MERSPLTRVLVSYLGGDEPRFWRFAALFLGIVSIAKGLRTPNQWSMTQAQMDYSMGFIRRGFFGALFKRALHTNLAFNYTIISMVLLFTLFSLLAWLALRSEVIARVGEGQMLALFASSYCITYLSHLAGYFDIPLAILCVLPLLIHNLRLKLAMAWICTAAGLLIHEQFLFSFLPVLLFGIFLQALEADSDTERRLAWIGGAGLGLFGASLTAVIALHSSLPPEHAEALRNHIISTVDFQVVDDFFNVESRSASANLALMRSVWMRPTFFLAQIESLLLFAPTAALITFATWRILRERTKGFSRAIFAGGLVATLCPLLLHTVGWDHSRWNELLTLNSFLVLLVVCRETKGLNVVFSKTTARLCLLLMMLNMASGGGMLDNRHIRPFPFMRGDIANTTQRFELKKY